MCGNQMSTNTVYSVSCFFYTSLTQHGNGAVANWIKVYKYNIIMTVYNNNAT